MKVTILGVTYESVDTPLHEQSTETCFDCDIYKSKPPQGWFQYQICCFKPHEYVNKSCCDNLGKGIRRIFKRTQKNNKTE